MADTTSPTLSRSDNRQYLWAIVLMCLIGGAIFVLISFARPMQDLFILGGIVSGFTAPTTLALLALMKAQETHLSVNSQLEKFIMAASSAARAEGVNVGYQEGRDMANKRTDELANKPR